MIINLTIRIFTTIQFVSCHFVASFLVVDFWSFFSVLHEHVPLYSRYTSRSIPFIIKSKTNENETVTSHCVNSLVFFKCDAMIRLNVAFVIITTGLLIYLLINLMLKYSLRHLIFLLTPYTTLRHYHNHNRNSFLSLISRLNTFLIFLLYLSICLIVLSFGTFD